MAPRRGRRERLPKREATQTGRPLSSTSKVVKHTTSKPTWQISLPIRPAPTPSPPSPLSPHLSAQQPASSTDASATNDPAPLPLLQEATASPSANAPPPDESESDEESASFDYVDVVYVQRRREEIVENIEAYSAQFENCAVSVFDKRKFFLEMRNFRNAPRQTKRLRNGSEASLKAMVNDFFVQFGDMFWHYDSDDEVDEDYGDLWIAEGVYAYFERMQRLRYRPK